MTVLDASKPIESTMTVEDIRALIRELEEVYNSLLREKAEKTDEDLRLIGDLYTLIVRLKKTLKAKMEQNAHFAVRQPS
ncbi:MAG: hypothetical protein QXK94_10415 [Candidatus Jordarchaeales archaeon]